MANNPDNYGRGVVVGTTQEADDMDLNQGRQWGTITSQYPRQQMVTVRWHGTGKYERWHVDLLEIIDRPHEPHKANRRSGLVRKTSG